MKKVMVIVSIMVMIFSFDSAFAGQFGAPEPIAKDNSAALGVGYFFSQGKFENDSQDFKMQRNEIYAQFSAATHNVEGYVRLGGSDVKLDDTFGAGSSFKDSGQIFGTVGAKGVYNITPYFGIGPFIQASLYSAFKDDVNGVKVELKDLWELAGGIAFQGKFDKLIVYAGPYLFGSGFKAADISYDAKSNFGGMAGLRFTIGGFSIEGEAQYVSEFSAGGAFCYSF